MIINNHLLAFYPCAPELSIPTPRSNVHKPPHQPIKPPKFSMCYAKGAVELSAQTILCNQLLCCSPRHVSMKTEEIWTDKTTHFQQHIHSHNNAVAFTSRGAKLDRQITLGCTHSNLRAPHHSMGSFLPPTKTTIGTNLSLRFNGGTITIPPTDPS
jgi:hypothetical protein